MLKCRECNRIVTENLEAAEDVKWIQCCYCGRQFNNPCYKKERENDNLL